LAAASFTGLSLGAVVDAGALCLTHPVLLVVLTGVLVGFWDVAAEAVPVFPAGVQAFAAVLHASISAGVQEATAALHAAISAGVQALASLQTRMQHPGGQGGQICAATWLMPRPAKKSRVINTCFMSSGIL
jgi:hypothetical protein